MLQNIISHSIAEKKLHSKHIRLPTVLKTDANKDVTMHDKSTSTEDLEKIIKERKILERFKSQVSKRKEQAAVFKQFIGSPKHVEEIEDE